MTHNSCYLVFCNVLLSCIILTLTGCIAINIFIFIFTVIFNALTFESTDLGSLFLVRSYIFELFRSYLYIKIIGSRSRS